MTAKQKKEMRQLCDQISAIRQTLEELLGDWTDKFDRRSEKWQESDAGQVMQERINELEEHVSHLEEVEGFTDTLAEEP